MSQFQGLIIEMISLLDRSGYCTDIQIIETSYFSSQQFAFKIRAKIFSDYVLQIRIYFNNGHFDYSYQVLNPMPLYRWDNKEHFPEIVTYPHHFHSIEANPTESPLTGIPKSDLEIVITRLEALLKKSE